MIEILVIGWLARSAYFWQSLEVEVLCRVRDVGHEASPLELPTQSGVLKKSIVLGNRCFVLCFS